MKITPLQYLLLTQCIDFARIREAAGISQVNLWKWRRGERFPNRLNAKVLIDLYGPDKLDYNGCYQRSVEITDEVARLHKLPIYPEQ